MQAGGRPSEVRLVGEVRDIDDQRIAVPVATRVAQILAHAWRDMRTSVQGDDASLVDHLVENHYVPGTLKNLNITVVGVTGEPWQTLRDTTLPQAPVEPRVGAAATLETTGGPQRPIARLHRGSLLRFRRQWRNFPVGRIHNQRRSQGPDDRGGPVPPERVISGADVAVGPFLVAVINGGDGLRCPLFQESRFLWSQELSPCKLSGSF